MTEFGSYNPLDKMNLARSIEVELLNRPGDPLNKVDRIIGAGVYVIYYSGSFPAYQPIAKANQKGRNGKPIYVGKAIPKGGRKGGLAEDASTMSNALASRLRKHASSITEVSNLDVADFRVQHLVIDDIWIPLGENMLIETFKPVWNLALDGFGNNDPGSRRATQYKSPWDIVHPGRKFADKLKSPPADASFFIKRITDYLAGRPMQKLPKALADQKEKITVEAEELADEI